MITLDDLEGALCVGQDPKLWDLDFHHHTRLGTSDCWLCLDAVDICAECPVKRACYKQAQETRESYCLRAGMAWINGRPKLIHRRRPS